MLQNDLVQYLGLYGAPKYCTADPLREKSGRAPTATSVLSDQHRPCTGEGAECNFGKKNIFTHWECPNGYCGCRELQQLWGLHDR